MANGKDREIRIAYRHGLQAPIFTLKASGVCERYGLDVTFHHTPKTEEAEGGLLNGTFDIVFGNHIRPFVDRAKGEKVVYIAQPMNFWQHSLIAKPGIKSLQDLKGKRLGVSGVGDHGELVVRAELKLANLNPKRDGIEVVEVEGKLNFKENYARVTNGEVDAIFVPPPFDWLGRREGLSVVDVPNYPQIQGATITTRSDFLQDNKETVQNLLKAYCEGLHYYHTHRDETIDTLWEELAPRFGIQEREAYAYLYDKQKEILEKKPYPTLEAIQRVFEIACWEHPELEGFNPLTVWDLHYVRELDETGFIDRLYA
jgi:ABC-type nitrate/sulfonate/bicarbonate transport system substrate-binding protein